MNYTKTVGEYMDLFRSFTKPFRGKFNIPFDFKSKDITITKGRTRPRPGTRKYDAAENTRLLRDWPTGGVSFDADLYNFLTVLRVRSRDLAKNNDYAKRFFNMLKQNVVGPRGIILQARSKTSTGELDKADNAHIENEWKNWGKLGVCSADGKLTWKDCQDQFIKGVARDGEAINRKLTNWPHNKYKFAIQFLEPDLLDIEANQTLKNGNTIRLGIEFDEYRRPVAYLFKRYNMPRNVYNENYQTHDRHERIPASEIIHEFTMDGIGQSRGVPWMHTAARRLQLLGGYEESEVVAARTAAAKMGFFSSETGDGYPGDDIAGGSTTEQPAAPIMNANPGTFEQLPSETTFIPWDPTHPTSQYEPFVLAILRGVASGLNVSYINLANDLRSVSFSSIRQGSLYENDGWRIIQGWMAEHYCQQVYEPWLKNSLIFGALKLPPLKFDKFNTVVWQGRGWQWVNPLQEETANAKAVSDLQKTPQQVAAEQGRDFDDVLDEWEEAYKSVKARGLPLTVFDKDWKKEIIEDAQKNNDQNS